MAAPLRMGPAAFVPPDAAAPSPTPIESVRSRTHQSRAAWAGWAAAAVLAGVVAGLSVQVVSQQDRINIAQHQFNTVTTQSAALFALLSAPDAHSAVGQVDTGGAVMVVDSRSRDEAAITLAGLAGCQRTMRISCG